ncbi:MAG: helix-turn-helix domain-containing protein [Anaerolineae bacterium]|nr:helix-turn-helix domain-containing protein [Anaerolineae bacterium]
METFFDRLLFLINREASGKYSVFAKKCGIPHATFYKYVKGRMPHSDHLARIHETFNVDLNWLLTGKGHPYIKEGGWDACLSEPGETYGNPPRIAEDPEVAELLGMTREIVQSDTSYALSLMANIRSFHQAMLAERRYNDIEERLSRIEREKSTGNHIRLNAGDRRQADRRTQDDPGKAPDGPDRRSGSDRRKASGGN